MKYLTRWPIALCAMLLLAIFAPAHISRAATLTVNDLSDGSPVAADGNCTLREAIIEADRVTADGAVVYTECGSPSIDGADTIAFEGFLDGTITLTAILPNLDSDDFTSINGDGRITVDAGSLGGVNVFTIDTDSVTIDGMTFINAAANMLRVNSNATNLTIGTSLGNTFRDNFRAIFPGAADNNTLIENNRFENNTIGVDNLGGNISLLNNSMDGGTSAIILSGSMQATIAGNSITNYTTAIQVAASANMSPASVGNCIAGNATGLSDTSTGSISITDSWWGAADGPNGGGVSGSGDVITSNGGSLTVSPFVDFPLDVCSILKNGSFESALTGNWQLVGAGVQTHGQAYHGDKLLLISGSGGLQYARQVMSYSGTTGDSLQMSARAGALNVPLEGNAGAQIKLKMGSTIISTKQCGLSRSTTTFNWKPFTCTITASGNFDTIELYIGSQGYLGGLFGLDGIIITLLP